MRTRFCAILVLLSWPLFSEPVEIMYYNFFGEYLVEREYHLDLNVQDLSLGELKQILEKQRKGERPMDADMVLIGYGANGYPGEFFAASNYVDDRTPLKNAIAMPQRSPDARFQIYFVDKFISPIVRKRQAHHWASPHAWLAQIGLQNLTYFGDAQSHRAAAMQ